MIKREKYKEILLSFLSVAKNFISKDSLNNASAFLQKLFRESLQKIPWKSLQKIPWKSLQETPGKLLRKVPWKSPQVIGTLGILAAVLFGGIFYYTTTTVIVGVAVNGQNVGYAASQSVAEEMLNQVLSEQGQSAGTIAQTTDTIEYIPKRVKKGEMNLYLTVSKEALASSITPFIKGYGIQIGEKLVVSLASEHDVESTLTKFKEYYAKPSDKNLIESVEITENISAVPVEIHPSKVATVDQAFDILLKGEIAEVKYTVEKNDSWWLIARKNDMTVKELLASNPEFNEDSIIQPGQVVNLVKAEPYLTVVAKGTKLVNEVIPFDVVTKTDSKLAAGKSVVTKAGKDGEKVVTYNYVEKNGTAVEKQVVKEEVIAEPVQQVVAKGPIPTRVTIGTSRGSGSISGLVWPLSGRITSYYGYRSGGFHTGIDIDGSTGQPYVAAAGGTVVSAGWDGGYGYAIVVDHGNGVATRYAHSSKLNVKVGQEVSRGQTIGLVGSTGRSTGSHLHFEVIINGSHGNPLNYL